MNREVVDVFVVHIKRNISHSAGYRYFLNYIHEVRCGDW